MNRESWLNTAADRLCEQFIFETLDVHISVGWPSRGGLSNTKRRIGECWKPETSKDGKSHIFISPMLEDAEMVLATLLHELIHAWDRCESGHKGRSSNWRRSPALSVRGPLRPPARNCCSSSRP